MQYLEIGQIVNTSGLDGIVKINAFTDDIRRFDKLKTIYIDKKGSLEKHSILLVRYNKKQVFLKLDNIDTIEEAEKLKGYYIKIDKKDAVKLPENTYFITDLLDLDVYTENDEYLGKIADIFSTGSNDVYVVKDESGKQILLPATQEVIKNIDIEKRKVIVNLIKGLIWKHLTIYSSSCFQVKGVMVLKFDVLTLFPEMFSSINESIIGKAIEKKLIEINLINIRDFSRDKHKRVDDYPYGGGAGMIIRPDVVYDAYSSVEKTADTKVIYLTPGGNLLNHKKIIDLANNRHLILLCRTLRRNRPKGNK